jgi:hypothetical protein
MPASVDAVGSARGVDGDRALALLDVPRALPAPAPRLWRALLSARRSAAGAITAGRPTVPAPRRRR